MTLWHDLGDLPEVSLVVTGAGTSLGWGSVGLLPLQPQVFPYWSLMAFFIFFLETWGHHPHLFLLTGDEDPRFLHLGRGCTQGTVRTAAISRWPCGCQHDHRTPGIQVPAAQERQH